MSEGHGSHGHGLHDVKEAFYKAKQLTDTSSVDALGASYAFADALRNDNGWVDYKQLEDDETAKAAMLATQKFLIDQAMKDLSIKAQPADVFREDQLLFGKYGLGVEVFDKLKEQKGADLTAEDIYGAITREQGFRFRQSRYEGLADKAITPEHADEVRKEVGQEDKIDYGLVGKQPDDLAALLRQHWFGGVDDEFLSGRGWKVKPPHDEHQHH